MRLLSQRWLESVRTRVAVLVARIRKRLDEHAKKDTEGWGARMEYKRRYTNPDEAKRHRAPLEKKDEAPTREESA